MTPVTVIGGYLGAGKTTLINHLLRHAGGRRLAVLVNEFGALPIDEDLIEARGEELIAIAGGCVCCAFGDNLIGALMDLSALHPPPEQIVIEASGVAIPGSIAASVSLLMDFSLNGVVVLADAETIRASARDKYLGDTILRQLGDADLIVLSKADLVDEQLLHDVAGWLGDGVSAARIIPARHGEVATDLLLGSSTNDSTAPPAAQGGHADEAFESLVFAADRPLDARSLAAELAGGSYGVIRAKGFVGDLSGERMLIQVVGKRAEVSPARTDAPLGVVCIGLSGRLEEVALRALFDAATVGS